MGEIKKRGGFREGAGRKKIRGKYFSFASSIEAEAVLNDLTSYGKSKTDFINEAIIFYSSHLQSSGR